jgi:hypothetical protein
MMTGHATLPQAAAMLMLPSIQPVMSRNWIVVMTAACSIIALTATLLLYCTLLTCQQMPE